LHVRHDPDRADGSNRDRLVDRKTCNRPWSNTVYRTPDNLPARGVSNAKQTNEPVEEAYQVIGRYHSLASKTPGR
jgi:hypothetical protein